MKSERGEGGEWRFWEFPVCNSEEICRGNLFLKVWISGFVRFRTGFRIFYECWVGFVGSLCGLDKDLNRKLSVLQKFEDCFRVFWRG